MSRSSSGHLNAWVPELKTKRGEHVLIAERVLGRPLTRGAEVHHINGDPSDNRNENLVICPDRAYHKLLHVRTRAYEACGHADWRPCRYCKTHDDPANMRAVNRGPRYKSAVYEHVECSRAWFREYRRA